MLIKLETDGADMHVPLVRRIQIWEEACAKARKKGCSVVGAPEYFFVSPAIKTQEAVKNRTPT